MEASAMFLRELKALKGPFETFEAEQLTADPMDLFMQWLKLAVAKEIPEPHAMTLSTVDAEGCPDARVLLLKRIDSNGFYFASSDSSQKGEQLRGNNRAALTFYWPVLGRQVRVRGYVETTDPKADEADFLARSLGARAIALTGRQSQVLSGGRDQVKQAVQHQKDALLQDPQKVAPDWRLYRLCPEQVEFWQGSPDRMHSRYQYYKQDGAWAWRELWP